MVSPSKETSLIYSYSSRPQKGISIKNYSPILPKHLFFQKIIGLYNFEIFLNKLESDRVVPEALLFGNRFSFSPNTRLNFSLIRVAQFGGEGRPKDLDTILKMLLGNDTTNTDLTFKDQPGNQLAGVDFIIRPLKKNNLILYGQYFGEDGLDPIIDDGWIGAIFPSKRFSLAGLRKTFYHENPLIISMEQVDTFSGEKNITYNHAIYKSGYRHKMMPIGANIDADSKAFKLVISKYFKNNDNLKITASDLKINRNNSPYNPISPYKQNYKELNIKYTKKYRNKYFISIYFSTRDTNNKSLKKNNIFFDVKSVF